MAKFQLFMECSVRANKLVYLSVYGDIKYSNICYIYICTITFCTFINLFIKGSPRKCLLKEHTFAI